VIVGKVSPTPREEWSKSLPVQITWLGGRNPQPQAGRWRGE